MMKRITLICALLGLVAFLAAPAYAEVQNIRVSGDINAMGVYRHNYDLEDTRMIPGTYPNVPYERRAEDEDSFFASIVRLRVDADMTDNVSATVRLANLREWDADGAATTDIDLDLAYVTLKEMLYSPLTLIIGRQNLNYGNGLVIGPGQYQDPNDGFKYDDLSPLHGFDAIRAILDYDPWTLDLVIIKIYEDDDTAQANDEATQLDEAGRDSDVDVYGANLGYKFGQYDAEMEGYIFYKRDEVNTLTMYDKGNGASDTVFSDNHVYTAGLRGSVVPTENLTLNAEIAGQWGEMFDINQNIVGNDMKRDRSALAANVAGVYEFANVRFIPTLGVEYLYLSGEEINAEGEHFDTDDFDGWDPMYRGKVMGTIRDCLENGSLYVTKDPADTSGWTNQHTVKLIGSLDLGELVDGLSLNLAYLHYWFDEEPSYTGQDDDIGNEVNMTLVYDYTEDVQFALDGAWFMPGDYYDNVHDSMVMQGGGVNVGSDETVYRVSNDEAVSIIGSCKVTF